MRRRLALISASVGALAVGGVLMLAPAANAATATSASVPATGCIVIPLVVPGWHLTICT